MYAGDELNPPKGFRKVFYYLGHYAKQELRNIPYVLSIVLFTAGLIYCYYEVDYIKALRRQIYWKPSIFLYYIALYGSAYFGAFFLYIGWRKKGFLLKSPYFWAISLSAVFIFTLRSSSHLVTNELLNQFRGWEHFVYWKRILQDLIRGLIVILPVSIIWFITREKGDRNMFGFSTKNVHFKIYFIMLGIMLIPVLSFAFTDHFLASYPRASGRGFQYFDVHNASDRIYFLFYEFIYGLDFVSIEYFFRGFLVIAFIRLIGPGAILPMAVFYVSIHYNKPAVETMSSFFGGSLLGILSYYTRSILGGIMVHVGIAWLMEIGGFVAKFRQ
jgi:hypothetical protein